MAACERRETHTRSSGEVKGSGKWGGCALAHCMCSIWAPARLTRPREGTFTKKVHNCPSQGGRGDCDGRVDEYAYLIIPVQPKFTQQRLVLTIDVGHALERRHDQHGEAGQHVVGKCAARAGLALTARLARPRPKFRRREASDCRRCPALRREKLRVARSPSWLAFYFTAQGSMCGAVSHE